jgi:hypothetical protein
MHLKNAESGGLLKHTRPGLGIEFVRARIERERIGAIRTAQWAAMRQLGQKAEGIVKCCAISRHLAFFLGRAGHGRPKDGVASLAYVPAIHGPLLSEV